MAIKYEYWAERTVGKNGWHYYIWCPMTAKYYAVTSSPDGYKVEVSGQVMANYTDAKYKWTAKRAIRKTISRIAEPEANRIKGSVII